VENYGQRHLGYNFRQKAGVAQQVSGGRRPDYGRYFSLQFHSNPSTQQKVMEIFRGDENVMRCMSYKTEEKSFSRAKRNVDTGAWARDSAGAQQGHAA
jgi:ribosomal protein S6